MVSRCVLVVAPSPRAQDLLDQLTLLGWQAWPARDLAVASQIMATRRFEVALLVLDSDESDSAQQFEACLAVSRGCEWVGVFPPGIDNLSRWRDHILDHFFDHHTAPADLTFLCQSLGHAWGRAALRGHGQQGGDAGGDMGMVGESAPLKRLRGEVRKAGPSDAPVLVAGESGSGKELVARALHAGSHRAKGPFVPVNCGALPSTLIHSELFGHERGSFTGATSARRGVIEAARGGTLFLDEIAELPMETQATLLRFLQERKFVRVGGGQEIEADVRIVAASHVDLGAACAAGRFRSDLYFRLNVLSLHVPPLRERKGDIPRLARYAVAAAQGATAVRGFHSSAVAAMLEHDWPGNVRELFNRVQRATVMADQALIHPQDLGLGQAFVASAQADLQDARVEAEKSAIRGALVRVSQNVTLAARELGVSRMTLYRLMAKHSITPRSA